jgi:hypothetical protein
MHPNTIKIDNVEYVRADQQDKLACNDGLKFVIIRTATAGVHAGYLKIKDKLEVTLQNARRIYYWEGAATLSQMAIDGVAKPDKCKFPPPVPLITLQWIEIIPCTEKAMASILGVKEWRV